MIKNDHKSYYGWAEDLYPMNRSLTGDGFKQSLEYFRQILPDLKVETISSGTQVFDWTIPQEWNVREAWVKDSRGVKVIDFRDSNLHLIGYSEPIHKILGRSELLNHIHTLPDQPNAIPYVTSYYKRTWGFCISHNDLNIIKGDEFEVYIDSSLADGELIYGELYLPGKSKSEVLFSTYLCHPSMANNELSGPIVTTGLAQWLTKKIDRKYSYRFLFLPETIGSIAYLHKNLAQLKKFLIAGWVLTCIGDNRVWSYLPSRHGNTLADKLSKVVLSKFVKEYLTYSWLDRGSDERQYCSPGVDLPVASLMRSKYGEYPEYHTSLDDLSLISEDSLTESVDLLKKLVMLIENRITYMSKVICEPHLGKRNLYPTLSMRGSANSSLQLLNVLSYCDGTYDLSEIAETCKITVEEARKIVQTLISNQLIEEISTL